MQDVTAEKVRKALKTEGMPLRCEARQLSNWVHSERKRQGLTTVKPNNGLKVLELEQEAKKWLLSKDWRQLPVEQLFVFKDYVISETQLFVAWSTPGMLERAKSAKNKVVKFVVDGKQKIVANDYTVVTLSFMISSEKVSRPTVRHRNLPEEAHCSTQEPFLQALMDAESTANMKAFFKLAIEIGEKECELDLREQVRQVHKDYAKGIEAARKECFPGSRPCDDYAHMRRATHKVLESMMCRGIVSAPQHFTD